MYNIPAMTPGTESGFVIKGGKKLHGSVITNRSKNGAVALLAASLLNKGTTTLHKVPNIEEVHRLVEVLESIGMKAAWDDHTLILTPPAQIDLANIDREAAVRTRSILMFIGPLLHEFRSFDIPQSGGCDFGTRSVRPHLWALERFGVSIEAHTDRFAIAHTGLSPATIVLNESSDTATINALYAAARIPATSIIKYASANYQVQEACGFLRQLGVTIEGLGTSTLTVTGVPDINVNVESTIGEDPIDSMFFIAAAATTGSELTVRNAPIDFLEIELSVLEKMGLDFTVSDVGVSENGITKLVDIHIKPSELTAYPERIHPRPYPGLNIDNLPFFAVIATQAAGDTLINDWVFEKRAIYYTELDALGATTLLLDPHRIQITGPKKLRAADIVAPPALRPATILIIAMLAAHGTSVLRNIYIVNRGYEGLVSRLTAIGADISSL
ncbi:MAG: UDP-N-acetylglucosamine 1-carboxyvinyltransferase [Parcubacteria group bacterium]|nr:UDP-N-acetylglucosamine 1-carboxyvinyltransferase [Parcubacteria group bacterium]